MTPEQSKEWFERQRRQCINWPIMTNDVEAMYQAFKARLIEETTCCELPK